MNDADPPNPAPPRRGRSVTLREVGFAGFGVSVVGLIILVLARGGRGCDGSTRDGATAARGPTADAADGPAGDTSTAVLTGRVETLAAVALESVVATAIDEAGRPLAETKLAPDGGFRFELSGTPAAAVLVSAPDLPSVTRRIDPQAGTGSLPAIPLLPGDPLVVRVVDDRGEPVAGAFVAPDPADPALTDGERRAIAGADAARSGADGTAVVVVRESGAVEIVVDAPGHVPARLDPIALPAAGPFDVELPRGGRLVGLVSGPDGAPRAGAVVRVVGSGLWPAREFPTDAQGRFDTGLLPPGFYEAEAFDEARISRLASGLEVRAAEDRAVGLALEPAGTIRGRVAAEAGAAARVADLVVTVHGPHARLVPLRSVTAEDGSFVAGPLRPGRYLVRCAASPFLPAEAWTDVAADAVADVVLPLRLGRTLVGTVAGAGDAPVAGARISLSGTADDGAFVFRSPTTEALARLDRRGLAPVGRLLPIGELGVLEGPLPPIPPRPFAWLESQGIAPAPAPSEVEGPVPAPSEVEGPVPERSAAPGPPPEGGALVTDARGGFVLEGLPPGRYAVAVTHADYAPLVQEVIVAEGAPRTVVRLRLTEGCTLQGRVLDGAGDPVAEAAVWISAGAGIEPLVWRTDASGAFTARHLPAHVSLRVLAPGFAAVSQEQDLAGTPCGAVVDLSLGRLGGRVEGRVIDSRRFPIGTARVRAAPAAGAASWPGQATVTARDGSFSLAVPAAGEVRLTAGHPDYLESSVVARPGEEVEITLSPGVRLRGSVADEVRAPLPATIAVYREGALVGTAAGRADGSFDAGRVAPGTYEVRASAPGFADASVLVGVAEPEDGSPDAAVDVGLSLRRGVALEGRVVDRFGVPVAGADVDVRRADGRSAPRRTRSAADGAFSVPGLEAGRYRVAASREDLGAASAEATLDVGTVSRPVEVVFRAAAVERDAGGGETSGRVGYTVVNGEVIVRAPAAYHASGTDVLRAGDVIVVVEREEIRDTETLRAVLAGVRRATVSVALERDGRRRYVTVDREALLADGW